SRAPAPRSTTMSKRCTRCAGPACSVDGADAPATRGTRLPAWDPLCSLGVAGSEILAQPLAVHAPRKYQCDDSCQKCPGEHGYLQTDCGPVAAERGNVDVTSIAAAITAVGTNGINRSARQPSSPPIAARRRSQHELQMKPSVGRRSWAESAPQFSE